MKRGEEHSHHVLGYPQLLEEIAGYVQSSGGRRRVLALRPVSQLPEIQRRRGLYEDLIRLSECAYGLPSLSFEELGGVLVRVQPENALLDGMELRLCLSQLQLAWELRQFLSGAPVDNLPVFSALVARIDPCEELRLALARSVDVDGGILDGASEVLRDIRRRRSATERHIQRSLDELVHSSEAEGFLQDRFVTQRNGRYVIPVKRDSQSRVPGLVHDISSSGQTVFVEPSSTLAQGNELSTLAAEEREEVRRILARLSEGVRRNNDALRQNEALMEELDAAAAVARWAAEYSCVLPAFGGFLKLSCARHPLLLSQFRREGAGRKVVPLDLELPRGTTTLAITGSNTGGKTVILKTVGLLALAAQTGLPVPAGQDSLFPVFKNILADIGDEQSLNDNLSTFSGHLANMSSILHEVAGEGESLVLLDELGSGTDPAEGGAIACAVLKELARHKCLTMATTHLGVVKNYVHATNGMVNGAVRFDEESLQPEYVLELGRPGASHALEIARSLGMPPHVLKSAEGFINGEELRLEELLSRLEAEHKSLLLQKSKAKDAADAAEAAHAQARRQLQELKETRKKKLNDAISEASSIVDNTRRQLENLLRDVREAARRQGRDTDPEDKVEKAASMARKAIAKKQDDLEKGFSQTSAKPAVKSIPADKLAVGRRIWVERLAAHGRVLRVDQNRRQIEVDVNGIPFVTRASEVFPEMEPEPQQKAHERIVVKTPVFQGQTSHEILLVGMRVEDAIDRLTQYLNDCVLANLTQVRVVHGFGTGRLREAIHQFLKHQSFVKSFCLGTNPQEGGAGVTFVNLQ